MTITGFFAAIIFTCLYRRLAYSKKDRKLSDYVGSAVITVILLYLYFWAFPM